MAALGAGVEVVSVKEPIVQIQKKPKYGVLEGPQTVSWQQFPASSVTTSNIQIQCNQPDRKTIVDRRVYLSLNITLTFTGTSPSALITLLNLPGSDSLRAYPLTSIISSMTMKIGGKAVTVGNMNDFWPYLMRYHNMVPQRDTDLSIAPAMLDQFQEYADGAGTSRNPLAAYGVNTTEMSRGGWTFAIADVVNGVGPGTTTSTVTFTVQEPLFMSPFLWAKNDHEPGMIGIDTFNFNATFGDFSRMWSRYNIPGGSVIDPDIPGQGITAVVNSGSLLFRQLTPNPITPIPAELAYSYFNPVLYTTAMQPMAPGEDTTASSSIITLPGIPRRLYVWVSETPGDQTFLTSDTMFSLDNVTVKWGTNTYLREARPIDLYNIAAKNGVNLSWAQWTFYTGAILCLDMGSDIGLSATEAAGSEGKYQLQIIVTTENLSSRPITPILNIVAVQEGLIEIKSGTVYIVENPVGSRDVLEAKSVAGITYKSSESVYGGDFFSDLVSGVENFGRRVLGLANKASRTVGDVARFAAPLHPSLRAVSSAADRVRALTGGRRMVGVGSRMRARRALTGRGFDEVAEVARESKTTRESKEEAVDVLDLLRSKIAAARASEARDYDDDGDDRGMSEPDDGGDDGGDDVQDDFDALDAYMSARD
jgi:hypothetical protein